MSKRILNPDHYQSFDCPLCGAETEYRNHYHGHGTGSGNDRDYTHAWVCTECPFIGFEYINSNDISALNKIIK